MPRMVVHEKLANDPADLVEAALIPYDKLFTTSNGEFVQGVVETIIPEKKGGAVRLTNGKEIPYDVLVLAPGSHWDGPLNFPDDDAGVKAFITESRRKFSKANKIVLVGGGAVGVEFAGEIKDIWPKKEVTIVHGDTALLNSTYGASFRKAIYSGLHGRGVNVVLGDYVDEFPVDGAPVRTRNGSVIEADLVVSTKGPRPRTEFVGQSLGEDVLDERGQIKVQPSLQLPRYPNIFAIGDAINTVEQKQVLKAQAHAALVAGNIATYLANASAKLKPYKGSTELIMLTNGRNGGRGYIDVLWGIQLGNFFAKMAKSKELLVPMARKQSLFDTRHGQSYHTFERKKVPYPLAYTKNVFELEALDMRLVHHLNDGSVSFVDFTDENWVVEEGEPSTPQRSLDIGCGTGAWVIDAAKEWPDCEFVGFDLMDIQIPLRSLSPEYAAIAERVTWVHSNFLTNKLPFDDDEFDHVHIQGIAQGVPENKWGPLFEEVNRVLRPGGVVEIMEDDIIFPLLPRWFTAPLRARPRRSTSVHFPDGTHRGLYPFNDTHSDTMQHDHALLESLYKSVFESRFINLSPTAILPSYFTTYFRHVTLGPVISFFMPPVPPLQPLPPQIITSYVIDPNSDTLDSRTSTVFASPNEVRATSLSFSSSTTESSQASSMFTGTRRKSSSVSTYDSPSSGPNEAPDGIPDGPPKPPAPPRTYTLDMAGDTAEEPSSPSASRKLLRKQLGALNERSLAMHLYRSYQLVIACQEEMWEELKDRLRNRKDELKPFGWEDDEELEELQNRKKFELLVDRYRTYGLFLLLLRLVNWWIPEICDFIVARPLSLQGIGWLQPPREPLSKAELIEEERIRAAILEARAYADIDEAADAVRAVRVLVGYKL
ncbi:UBIQUITIN-CONJUGAT-2 domain-containing protein [Mycena kentingensis (nom. inval.)]|nr:UBIQUITIN-CONJUGAT-2 domain-containing protein [Mycena kentingensis (nom. inval.)]